MYRRFTYTNDGDWFRIFEVEPTDKHPMNWIDGMLCRESVWSLARCQIRPVRVFLLDGTMKELGIVFDSSEFEKVCYSGYVSYGLSMTDGHYGPLTFTHWVEGFRKDPANKLKWNNDTPAWIKESLSHYQIPVS